MLLGFLKSKIVKYEFSSYKSTMNSIAFRTRNKHGTPLEKIMLMGVNMLFPIPEIELVSLLK